MASNDDFRTFKHNIISNYKTIKSRKEYLSKILKTYNNGESQRLNDDDAEIVKIFYEEFYQPVHRDEKYSSNEISHIESIDYTDENNYRSRCLRFNFIDKKCGRIGIKHLVGSKLNTQTNFKILLGKAINPQIQEFKSSQINMDDASKYDVDHLKTFESLVQGFIEENRELKDFNAKRLPDETKKKWIDCHKKHATLQLIKKEDHREKTKNDSKQNNQIITVSNLIKLIM